MPPTKANLESHSTMNNLHYFIEKELTSYYLFSGCSRLVTAITLLDAILPASKLGYSTDLLRVGKSDSDGGDIAGTSLLPPLIFKIESMAASLVLTSPTPQSLVARSIRL